MSLAPEVRRGGTLPFGMVASKWMCDPRYSTNARTLYAILVTYADTQSRNTGRGKPYRTELAKQLGVSLSTLDRTLDELEVGGLLRIEERVDPSNPKKNDANVYHLLDFPLMYAGNGEWTDPLPPGIKAADAAKQRTEERRAAKREQGIERKGGVPKGVNPRAVKAAREAATSKDDQDEESAGGGSTHAATPGSTHAATLAAPVLPNVYSPVQTPSLEPNRGDGRRPTAGGFARASASDSAAPQSDTEAGDSVADRKTPPARKQRKAQKITEARPVEGEAEAWQALDAVLAELGERRGTRPPTLRKAVRLLLGHDTDARGGTVFAAYPRRPEHVLGRLNRGWYRSHGPERSAAGYDGATYGEPIRRPVGYLAEVLVAQDCSVPECELGVLLTSGEECRVCEQREAERAVEATAARLERETAQLAEKRKAAEQADDDRFHLPEQRTTWRCEVPTCRRAGRGTPPEVLRCEECLAEAEETARLRAEITKQHPELAAVASGSGPAPF